MVVGLPKTSFVMTAHFPILAVSTLIDTSIEYHLRRHGGGGDRWSIWSVGKLIIIRAHDRFWCMRKGLRSDREEYGNTRGGEYH